MTFLIVAYVRLSEKWSTRPLVDGNVIYRDLSRGDADSGVVALAIYHELELPGEANTYGFSTGARRCFPCVTTQPIQFPSASRSYGACRAAVRRCTDIYGQRAGRQGRKGHF